MVTADPFRTPTFTPFADPNWFFFATGVATPATCATPDACAFIPARTRQSFAWNHGDIQDEIASTWVGYVGQGVDNGPDNTTWSDHTDVRPTILELVGLKDDYAMPMTREYYLRNREALLAKQRARYHTDAAYRDK